jgi:hypothetical protein
VSRRPTAPPLETAAELARTLCRALSRPADEEAAHEAALRQGRAVCVYHDHIDIWVAPDGFARVEWRAIPPPTALAFVRWLSRRRRV